MFSLGRSRVGDLESEINRLRSDLSVSRSQLDEVVANFTASEQRLQRRIDDLTQDNAVKQNDLQRLANDLNKLQQAYSVLKNEDEKKGKELGEKDGAINKLKKQVDSLQKANDSLNSQVTAAQQNPELKAQIDTLTAAKKTLKEDLDGKETQLKNLQDRYLQDMSKLENKITALTEEAQAKDSKIAALTEAAAAASQKKETVGENSGEAIDMKNLNKKLQDDIVSLQVQIAAMDEKHKAVVGVLEDSLRQKTEEVVKLSVNNAPTSAASASGAPADEQLELMKKEIVQLIEEAKAKDALIASVRTQHEKDVISLEKEVQKKDAELAKLRETAKDARPASIDLAAIEKDLKRLEVEVQKKATENAQLKEQVQQLMSQQQQEGENAKAKKEKDTEKDAAGKELPPEVAALKDELETKIREIKRLKEDLAAKVSSRQSAATSGATANSAPATSTSAGAAPAPANAALEIARLHKEIEDLKRDVERRTVEARTANDNSDNAVASLEECENKLKLSEKRCRHLQTEKDTATLQLRGVQQELMRATQELTEIKQLDLWKRIDGQVPAIEEMKLSQKSLSRLELEKEDEVLRQENAILRVQLAGANTTIARLTRELDDMKRDKQNLEGDFRNVSDTSDTNEALLEECEKRLKGLEKTNKQLLSERDSLSLQLRSTQKELMQASQELSAEKHRRLWMQLEGEPDEVSAKAKIEELNAELESREQEVKDLKIEISNAVFRQAQAIQQLEDCKRDRDAYVADVRAVTDTLGDTEEQLEETEKKLKAAEKMLKQTQADRDLYSLQLRAAQNELLSSSQELSLFKSRELWKSMEAEEEERKYSAIAAQLGEELDKFRTEVRRDLAVSTLKSAELTKQLNDCIRDRNNLEGDLRNVTVSLEESEDRLEEEQKGRRAAEKLLKQVQSDRDSLSLQLRACQQEMLSMSSELSSFKNKELWESLEGKPDDNRAKVLEDSISSLEQEISEVRATLKATEEKLEHLQAEVQDRDVTIAQLQSTVQEKEGSILGLQGQLQSAQSEASRVSGEVDSMKQQFEAASSKASGLETDVGRLQSEKSELESGLASLRDQFTALSQQILTQNHQIYDLSKQLDECRRDRDIYLSDSRAVTNTLGDVEEQLEDTEKKLKAAEKSLKQALSDKDMFSLQLRAAQNELLTASQELSAFKNRELWKSMEAEEEERKYSAIAAELEVELDATKTALGRLQAESAFGMAQLRRQLEECQRDRDAYQSEARAVTDNLGDSEERLEETEKKLLSAEKLLKQAQADRDMFSLQLKGTQNELLSLSQELSGFKSRELWKSMEKEEEERKYSAIAAELEIELEAKKMELTTLQKERARMYNEMSYQIAHLTKGLEECKRDRDSYFSDARAVTDTLGDTEEQLEETEKKLKAAEKSLKQAQADRDLYSLQLKAAQNELLTASQELSGFKNRQLWESMEAKESNEALSMMTKEEVQQLELDLESARAVVKEKESEVASLTNTVETLRASSKQIEQTYRSQIEKIQEQFADLQKKTQEQQQQLQQEIMAFTQAGIPNP